MDKLDPPVPFEEPEGVDSDLAQRLARLRRRVEAEGRPRSVNLIDKAIEKADREGDGKG
jgi:hypothetical protein